MCSISYFSKEYFIKNIKKDPEEYVDKVEDRWLDSLWILSLEKWKRKISKVMPSIKQQYFTDEIQSDYAKEIKQVDSSCMIHLRNSSVWAVTLKNGHPYNWNRYVLAQNWTSRDLHAFFKIKWELEWFNHSAHWESDSAALLSYIEYQDYKNLKDIYIMLKKVVDVLWVIFIYDKQTGNALIYTDWCREFFISIKDNVLLRAENYKSDTEKNRYSEAYIIFNFETGKIIEKKGMTYKKAVSNTYQPWMYGGVCNY